MLIELKWHCDPHAEQITALPVEYDLNKAVKGDAWGQGESGSIAADFSAKRRLYRPSDGPFF